MDLINAMQTQFSSAKRALNAVIFLGIAQFLLVIFSMASSLKNYPFKVAITMFFIQVAIFYLKNLSQTKYIFSEEIRRAALLKDSLGLNLPSSELARLQLRVGTSKNREPPFIRAYYSSTLPAGPARLLESFHESVFFSFHLAETLKWIFLTVAVGGAAASAIAAIILFGGGIGATDTETLAQIGIAAIAFFAAGDMLQMALNYHGLHATAEGLLRSCDAARSQSSPSKEEITNLAYEYAIALIHAPILLSSVYRIRQGSIQSAWDNHLKSL